MEQVVFLIILTFVFVSIAAVDYSDLQALGAACPPRDTCSNTTGRTFCERNCECDSWCQSFDDCCVNAPLTRNQNGLQSRMGLTCLQVDSFHGVYAIATCGSSWNGSEEVRRKCENEDDFSDPFMSRPSTDTRTNVTYRNQYCAECNYGHLGNFPTWNTDATCSSLVPVSVLYNNITRDFILKNIVRLGDSWGVYHWNESTGSIEFSPCQVSNELPDNLAPHVRYCRPQVVSTCATNWRREVIRKHCLSYMAVIYIDGQAYRNPHCALCNRVSLENRTCVSFKNTTCSSPGGILSKTKPSLSFTLLMDVNRSDGDNVGERNPCSSGETYDPFAKMCRSLVCAIPGFVLKDGKCVPE